MPDYFYHLLINYKYYLFLLRLVFELSLLGSVRSGHIKPYMILKALDEIYLPLAGKGVI